jgi:hypothetical protein
MALLTLLGDIVPDRFGTKEVKQMLITVKVSKKVTGSLQKRKASISKSLNELLTAEKELGIVLGPLHPGAMDPYLSPYFKAKVTDHAKAKSVINRLLNCKAVEAAYLKSSNELPKTARTQKQDELF